MDNLEYHPLANLFPLIEGEQFDDLVGDIRDHGLQDQIDLFQGKILDGRNRYRAAKEAGIELTSRNFRHFHPEFYGDPLAYVISKNLTRRHLDESQRAMVAARLATMRQGERTDKAEPSANLPKVDQPAAAKTLSISERALRHARVVQDHGVPELGRAVDRGRLSVSVAEKAARLGPELQRKVAAEAEAGNEGAARHVVKREMRANREAELAERTTALPKAKFNVIYADPAWETTVYSDETGHDRSPENHYPTMTLAEILDLDVPSIAADDCVLFMWTTPHHFVDALYVMEAWGFLTFRPRGADGKLLRGDDGELVECPGADHKSTTAPRFSTQAIWLKDRMGLGRWFRNKHEHLLIGIRGNIPAPLPGTQSESVIAGAVRDHSRKPLIFRAMIEALFPNLPKIELFARTPAPGWGQWGKEAPEPVVDETDTPAMTRDEKHEASLLAQHNAEMEAETPPTSHYLPKHDPETGEIEDDGLGIPQFLKREPVAANN